MRILAIQSILVFSAIFSIAPQSQAAPIQQPLSLEAQETIALLPKRPLYCEFWTGNQFLTLPSAFLIYDPSTQTVWTRTGSPLTTQSYINVAAQVGVPPYGDVGYTIVAFGDVPLVSVKKKSADTIPLLAYVLENHQSTSGKVLGLPVQTLDNGLCFFEPFFKEDFYGW